MHNEAAAALALHTGRNICTTRKVIVGCRTSLAVATSAVNEIGKVLKAVPVRNARQDGRIEGDAE